MEPLRQPKYYVGSDIGKPDPASIHKIEKNTDIDKIAKKIIVQDEKIVEKKIEILPKLESKKVVKKIVEAPKAAEAVAEVILLDDLKPAAQIQEKGHLKIKNEKRTCSDISKIIAMGIGIAVLSMAAVALSVALVAGIAFLAFPSGVGAAAAIGSVVTSVGVVVGAFATKVFTWIIAHAAIVTAISSVSLAIILGIGTAIGVAAKCAKQKKGDNPIDDKIQVEDKVPEAAVL